MPPQVHKDLQRCLSEAATHIANDELTKARDCFERAVSQINVITGTLSPLSTNPGSKKKTSNKRKPKP